MKMIDFKGKKSRILISCGEHKPYEVIFDNFTRGKRCPYCSGLKKLTYDEVKIYIESFGYKLISSEYLNNRTKLDMICEKGHNISMRFDNFKSGKRCSYCSNNVKLTQSQVDKLITSSNYKLLSEYKSMHEPIVIQCDNGHIYKTSLNSFKNNGCRCPICTKSKGEIKISSILNRYNIEYIQQYTFDDCKNINTLPFDFYIQSKNICIEYDGVHHFEPTDFAGKGEKWAKEQFEKTIYRDSLKNDYCKNNNIKLIRIPYWDFENIENILCEQLELK